MPVTYMRRDLPDVTSDWTASVSLDRVDPATVQSVTLALSGTLVSQASVESLEAAPSLFQSADTATITLQRPDGASLLTATPTASLSAALAAWDGSTDLAGPSGRQL